MDFEMYGIGCAFCGRAVHSWRGGRTWPCACPTPTPGHDARTATLTRVVADPDPGTHRHRRPPREAAAA